VVEAADLPAIGNMLVGAFYPELLTLSPGFSPLERSVFEGPIGWLNASLSAYLSDSILHFVRTRLGSERLAAATADEALALPTPRRGINEGRSIALVAADESSGRILAFVELSVRALDGQVPTDMLDDAAAFAQRLLRPQGQPLEKCAYLCNLCVASAARRRGIGSALVRASESVVGPSGWGFAALHLHVGTQDEPTRRLYRSLGFRDLREYDPPQWKVRFLGTLDCTFCRRIIGAPRSSPDVGEDGSCGDGSATHVAHADAAFGAEPAAAASPAGPPGRALESPLSSDVPKRSRPSSEA
jgi:ribosomal protein S18 acetylase RimI-like enzyme